MEAGHRNNTAFQAYRGFIQWSKSHSIALLPRKKKGWSGAKRVYEEFQSSYSLFSTGQNSCAVAPIILQSCSTLPKIWVTPAHAVENLQGHETNSQTLHAGQSKLPSHLPYLHHAVIHD